MDASSFLAIEFFLLMVCLFLMVAVGNHKQKKPHPISRRGAVRLRNGECQRSANPAALPVAQDSPSAPPLTGGVGPNDVPQREEHLHRNDCCVGVGLPEQFICLVERGPWSGRKELRCRGFGNTLNSL